MNRRTFITNTAGTIIAGSLLQACMRLKNDYLILSASHADKHKRESPPTRKNEPKLAVYDSRTQKTTVLDVPSLTHSVIQNPAKPLEFLCLPKIGKVAFVYNHQNKSFIPFEAQNGLLFYGHGVYSPDGSRFYTSQSLDTPDARNDFKRVDYKGSVAVWGSVSLEPKGELDTYGHDPHDMQVLDGGRMLIANGGENTNVSIVELTSGKLLEQFPCDIENVYCRHLAVSKKGEFYVLPAVLATGRGSACRVLYPENGVLKPFDFAPDKKEALSTQLLSGVIAKDYIVTTAPRPNSVHIWSKKTRELIEVMDFEEARGVFLSEDLQHIIVTSGYEKDALVLNYDNAKIVRNAPEFNKLTGSHTTLAIV